MTISHVNVFENLAEAQLRLRNTYITYEGEPYYVLAITDHKKDGIFRMYLQPLSDDNESDYPSSVFNEYHPTDSSMGPKLDNWLEANPKTKILRKMMNSPAFNRFRPYPLGMMNLNGTAYYMERNPVRKSEQGLTSVMLTDFPISLGPSPDKSLGRYILMMSKSFRDCVVGEFPTVSECLTKMRDPLCKNVSVGFHRNFAIARGPIDTLLLGYKRDIVGLLPSSDLSLVKLAKTASHLREAVAELNLFNSII